MTNINKQDFIEKTCFLYVQHIKNALTLNETIDSEYRVGFHSRLLEYMLHPEIDFIFKGRSLELINNDQKPYKEHIVPLITILNEVCRLIEAKRSDEEITKAMLRNLGIAQITWDEAKKLDGELKLKTKMPAGWDIENGDPMARLIEAEIQLVND